MSKRITRFVAKATNKPNYEFNVNARTIDEARSILARWNFNGRVYQEEYELICTTPHIVGEVVLGECDE